MPDAPLQESLDRITRLATRMLDVPMAVARLYDAGYQRYHTSYVGLAPAQQRHYAELLRDTLFSGEVRKVENVYRQAPNPAGDAGPAAEAVPPLCSYLLVPLRTAEGTMLGSLGVFDTRPRTFTPAQRRDLDDLARTLADVASWMPIASARRTREENWRDIVERYPDPVLIVADARIAYANDAAARLCGAAAAIDLVERSFFDFLQPTFHEAMQRRLTDLERGAALPPLAHAWIRLDGEQRVVEAHSGLVRFGGRPAVQIAFRDITVQREAEKRLLRIQKAVESASDAIGIADVQGQSIYHNPAMLALFGYTPEQLNEAGGPVALYDEPDFDAEALQALLRGEAWTGDVNVRTRDGRVVQTYLRASAIKDTDGQIVGVVGIHTDISERKRAEEALRESRLRLAQLVDTAMDAIITVDEEQRIEIFNTAAEQLFGYAADEIRGRPLSLLIPEPFRAAHARHVKAFGASTGTARRMGRFGAVRAQRRDGHEFPAEASISRIHVRDAVSYVVILRDITDRLRYEQDLVKAKEEAEEGNRLKSAFLANMSHEIRTPLTGILGLAQILAEEAPAHMQEFIQAINHSGRRLLETLTALLELSRLESGSFELHPSPFDLVDELTQSLSLFNGQVQAKQLDLIIETPTPTLPVRMDRGVLNSVLQNLVSNALKFTQAGRITVSVGQQGTDVVLRVQDTGIGISDSFLPYIFDGFKQESEGISREYEGAGLGLTLVRGMLDLMNGKIDVHTQKGQGSTFTVYLPDVVDEGQLLPSPASPSLSQTAHVLVVEDNEATQTFLRFALRKRCEAILAGDADEARRAWQHHRPDLVLMDINLGAGKGLGVELLHELRSDPATADIPVVAMTAYALPGDRERFLSEGFDAYLSKPFTKDQLHDLLARMLPDALRPVPPPRSA